MRLTDNILHILHYFIAAQQTDVVAHINTRIWINHIHAQTGSLNEQSLTAC